MSIRSLLLLAVPALVASAPAASSSTASSATKATTTLFATPQPSNVGLNECAQKIGKLWFGTAADLPGTTEDTDKYYMAEFNNTLDFGEATPANTMKFEQTQPGRHQFNFTGGDIFLDIAEATNKKVRCHNLIWSSELPDWVTSPSKPWTNATLSAVLREHVTTLIKHWGDRCYSWDVVNEALSDTQDNPKKINYTSNVWLQNIGPEYVPMAFAAAQKAVKNNGLSVKLYYNDYNIESPGAKTTAAQNLVKALKGRGIQIDGVGLESHFIVGETPSQADQVATKKAFVALDVDVAITELDVRCNLPPTLAEEKQQVADYYSSVKSCVNVKRCIGITVWDFDDTYSWVPGTFSGQGYADIFLQPKGSDHPLKKKAAYDGCLEALQGQPEKVPPQ